MIFYQAKQHHQHDIPHDCGTSVVVEGELFTEIELKRLKLPIKWFRKISLDRDDTFWFFGARFADYECNEIIEEDLT